MSSRQSSQRTSPAGNEALEQTQRLLAWTAYQESLKEVDQKAFKQFERTVDNLRLALWMRVWIYLAQFLVVSVALFVGLTYAIRPAPGSTIGIIIVLASSILLMILLARSPIQSVHRILIDLARVQIILQGYSRQINQVDATFKQDFLEKKVSIQTVAKSLGQIQTVIDGNIESLLQFLEEIEVR